MRASAAVDLVDDEGDRQFELERLAQHEAGLGQRPLRRVDEQQHPVDHRQRPFDLATEVGVARRVDDVDPQAVVQHRRVLGQDRDALLPLQIHVVHDPLVDVLVGAERAGLPQHRVDERGLAVVDVSDDCDVTEVGADGHRSRTVSRTSITRPCIASLSQSHTCYPPTNPQVVDEIPREILMFCLLFPTGQQEFDVCIPGERGAGPKGTRRPLAATRKRRNSPDYRR